MRRVSVSLVWVLAVSGSCALATAANFDLAYIGNAGNAPDAEAGYGAVSYGFAISKTEVTNAQYADFLNAVDPTGSNALGLFDPQMASSAAGGIRSDGGVVGANYYARDGRQQNPVTFVSWYDAARFVNWLHNGGGPANTEAGLTRSRVAPLSR